MNTHHAAEITGTYLTAGWRDTRTPWSSKPTGSFITLSREAGSGGSSLARLLARKLNRAADTDVSWSVMEGNITTRMLKENHLPPNIARFLPEDRIPEIDASIGEFVGLHPSLWELVQKTNETTRELARRGHVILVGRGANFATAGMAGGLHVRLVAPVGFRARYLAQLYNISESEALAANAKCDAARRRYVKTNFNADVADPTAYDLVINVERVPLPEAAKLIAAHLEQRALATA
ncbi:MAG: cytidylate kinase-like family protein [Verrucomicrobia bacterium]|nr:cytidylate kinase-like family protein [Verrucomicrobiota bacterium]